MRRRRANGFSLIELLAVVFILGLGLVGVSGLFVAGLVSSRQAERMSAAVHGAERQMERVRSAGFAACLVDPEIFPSTSGYTILYQRTDKTGRIGFPVPDLPSGQGEIDIEYYDSGHGIYPNLKDVTVTITWTGGRPTGGQTVLRTFIANRP